MRLVEDIDKTNRSIEKGKRADALLSDPIFVEIFDKIEEEYIKSWKNSDDNDVDEREMIYLSLKALGRIKSELRSVASNGKVSYFTLKNQIKV